MKKYLWISFLLPLFATAQDKEKLYGKITAQILNPDFYTIQLPFLSVDFARSNSNIFADMGGDAKFGKVMLGFKYRANYVDNLTEDMQNVQPIKHSSVNEPRNSRSLNVSMGYVVASQETTRDVSFHLKTTGNVRYYGTTKAPITRFHAVRVGYTGGFTVVNGTGTKMVFSTPNGEDKAIEPLPEETETVMGYKTLSLGYMRGHYGWWRAEIEGYGKREAQGMAFWYGNLLIMPNATLDDVAVLASEINYNKLYQRMSLKDTRLSKIGFNVGWQTLDFNGLGIAARLEAGLYPGIKGDFGSRFGLSISSGINIGKLFGKDRAQVPVDAVPDTVEGK
ncbi:MAG: hypothetical protein JNL57_09125 [Bacteroidetes bacterium]|nr:hypothetical protein [Bacteroidota bacterium]